MNTVSWPDWLRTVLCKLYQAWDGLCINLGETESEWVATVTGTYAAEGVPQFPDQQAVDRFLAQLDELEFCLDAPGNNLTETDNIALRVMIASLRTKLGAA